MEALNIELALKGHPVRLRNGEKAYIRHLETVLPVTRKLIGYRKPNSADYVLVSWTKEGENTQSGNLDIVGMWKAAPLVFLYWGEINREFNYIAKDRDGEWWAYAEKPKMDDISYDSRGGTDSVSLRSLSNKIFPDCDWYESLMERPLSISKTVYG